MKYNFEALNRWNTDSSKWDGMESAYGTKDLIPLWVADMDFPVFPKLSDELEKRAAHPTYGYTKPSDEYFESFINWNKNRNDYAIEKDMIISIPGVVCATSMVIHALTNEGDRIMLNTPIYHPFFSNIKEANCVEVRSSLKLVNGRYEFDFNHIEEELKQGVKLFILCSPHNPTGNVWKKEELERLVDLCYKYDTYIFSDEIHSDLIFKGHKHIPLPSLSDKAKEITVMATAPSKTFNVAGIKTSFMVVHNEELREKVKASVSRFHVGIDLFGYKAAEICYGYGEDWLEELLTVLEDNANFTLDYLNENLPEVKTYVPEGTYLMWLDFNHYKLEQDKLMDKLQNEAKVALNSGTMFGEEGKGFVRLNIGTSRQLLEKGLKQIVEAFK